MDTGIGVRAWLSCTQTRLNRSSSTPALRLSPNSSHLGSLRPHQLAEIRHHALSDEKFPKFPLIYWGPEKSTELSWMWKSRQTSKYGKL